MQLPYNVDPFRAPKRIYNPLRDLITIYVYFPLQFQFIFEITLYYRVEDLFTRSKNNLELK